MVNVALAVLLLCVQVTAFSSTRSGPVLDRQVFRKNGAISALKMQTGTFQGPGLVFSPVNEKTPSAFDSKSIGGPVIRRFVDEKTGIESWTMFYHGRSLDYDEDVVELSTGRVGMALSLDGIHWRKTSGSDFSENDSILTENTDDWFWFDTAYVGLGDVREGVSDVVRSEQASMFFMYYYGGAREQIDLKDYGLENPGAEGKFGLRTRIGVAVSADGYNWGRVEGEHATGAILDPGRPGDFDALGPMSPQIIAVGSEFFRLYYHSIDPKTKKLTVGMATSRDGFKFEKTGQVFQGSGKEGAFDENGAGRRHVLFVRELDAYLMFYEALDAERRHSIGLAVSKDGFAWAPMYDEPVFEPSGEEGAWDSGHVGSPYLVDMGSGVYRMYYVGSPAPSASGVHVASAVGVAECTSGDFKQWVRLTPEKPNN